MSITASLTLELLEQRLRGAEFLLNPDDASPITDQPQVADVNSRAKRLEHQLAELESSSRPAQELLALRSKFPELFESGNENGSSKSLKDTDIESVVLSAASRFSSASSGLTQLREITVPDVRPLPAVIALQPRLVRAQAVQITQAYEVEELRRQSATVIARWYYESVLEAGETWSEVENRMVRLEQSIRRREVAKTREKDEI